MKPNDGRITEGGPTNGTRRTDDTQDVSPNAGSARLELCVPPPTISGARSTDTPGMLSL